MKNPKNTKSSSFQFWQRIVSVVCSIALLAPLAVDYRPSSAAAAEDEHDLVVVLVNQDLFAENPDDENSVTGKIYRYAQDVQAAMPRTHTLVLPVSEDESPGDIFSVLEKLYLEGRARGQELFRLSGVVLVGDVPLPIIRTGSSDALSMFPYTDFESPAFRWNNDTEVFEASGSSQMQAEIFHGVIRAPAEASKTEAEWLKQYFDKNHAFHSGEAEVADQTLFFADMIGEFAGLHPLLLKMYEAAESIFASDIAHYRFNFSLYEDARALFALFTEQDVDLSSFPSARENLHKGEGFDDKFPYPDSLMHQYIRQYLPHFVKVAASYYSIADPLIKGSGRWMIDRGNVGTLPMFMSAMDVLSKETLRELEAEIHAGIFEFVDTQVQIPVEMLTDVNLDLSYMTFWEPHRRMYETEKNKNLLNGVWLGEVDQTQQCSLERGEVPENPREIGDNRQLASMNNLWNRFNELIRKGKARDCDRWGGCCIINSNKPQSCKPHKAKKPVYEPKGGKLRPDLMQPQFRQCIRIGDRISSPSSYYGLYDQVSYKVATKEASSAMHHNEPRPETIAAAIEETLSGAIPATENHSITYQGPGGDLIRLPLPDLTNPQKLLVEGGYESFLDAVLDQYEQVEKRARVLNYRSNLMSYVGYLKSQPRELRLSPTAQNLNPRTPIDETTTTVDMSVFPVPERQGYVGEWWDVEPYEGRPYLNYQIEEVWLLADARLQAEYPAAETMDDRWIAYLDNATEELRAEVEQLFTDIIDPTTYDDVVIKRLIRRATTDTNDRYVPAQYETIAKLSRDDIISFREFMEQGGGELLTWSRPESIWECQKSPRGEYFCLPNYTLDLPPLHPPTITFPVRADFSEQFASMLASDLMEAYNPEALREFADWRQYNPDEKHIRALELFWGKDTPAYLKGRSNGYEFSAMRAYGNSEELWWGGDEKFYLRGDDTEWDLAIPELPTLDEEDPAPEEDECATNGFEEGVPITEWLPAMQCWLDDTLSKPISIEFEPICSFTGILGDSDYDIYSDAWHAGPPQVQNGARINISGSSGDYLLAGEHAQAIIRFEQPDGSLVTGGVTFTARPIGDLEITGDSSFSSPDGGYVDTTFSGEFALPVAVTGNGRAGLRVSAEGFRDAQLMFAFVGDGNLLIENTASGSVDPAVKSFRVSVLNENGVKLSGYEGRAVAQISDPTAAELLNKNVPIVDGSGEVSLRLLGESSVILTVTLAGFGPGQIFVTGNTSKQIPVQTQKLAFRDPPDVIGAGIEDELEVYALDAQGLEIPLTSVVTLTATEKTADKVEIERISGRKFAITAGNRTGTVRLIAEADGFQPARLSLPIAFKITKEDLRQINPQTMAVSLLGSNFADFGRTADPIANALLFTEYPQAVLSAINPDVMGEPRLSVFNNGALAFFERGLEANIASYAPLTVRVFDRFYSEQVVEYTLNFSGSRAIAADYNSEQAEDRDGIFFRNYDRDGDITSRREGGNLIISYEDEDVLRVNTGISFTILNNDFSLEFEPDTDVPVISLLRHSSAVGDFILSGAQIMLLDAPSGATEFFTIPGNVDGSQGFSVVSDDISRLLPTGGRAFEHASETFGTGFHLDDNFSLQFASGVPLGEAAINGFGPNGILLGDPTVALGLPTEADENGEMLPELFAGFDLGVGKEIIRSPDTRFESAITFDYDGNDLPDILLTTSENRARVLKNLGDLRFRDMGEVIGDALGLNTPARIDAADDGYDDIIGINDNHELNLFVNEQEVMTRNRQVEYALPIGSFTHIQTTDFDLDGIDDLLLQNIRGELFVYWGNPDGFSIDERTLLGDFGTQIEPGNLAQDNTLVSIPNIQERTANSVPLYVIGPVGAEDGLTTIADVLVATGKDDHEAVRDPTFGMLAGLQEEFPEGFAKPITDTRRSDLKGIALFASTGEVARGLAVSLRLTDESGGAVNLGDVVKFTLALANNTGRNLHFSLAHVINPALAIDETSFDTPDTWPADRDEPQLQILSGGQLRILDLRLNAGESARFEFFSEMTEKLDIKPIIREDFSLEDFPADGKPDISVIIPGLNGQYHYFSGSNRNFIEHFEYFPEIDAEEIFGSMVDTDNDGVPDQYMRDTNGDGVIDLADQILDEFSNDSDDDGFPDAWDEMNGVWNEFLGEDWANALEQLQDIGDEIMSYTACDGGCLNIPINFAFLVPGTFNLFETLMDKLSGIGQAATGASESFSGLAGTSGSLGAMSDQFSELTGMLDDSLGQLQEALDGIQEALGIPSGPITGWPVFGVLPYFPFVCTGVTCYPSSTFRMYVSPTLTGGVGVAFCVGAGAPVAGFCKAFAPSKLNISFICDEPASKRGVLDETDANGGQCSFQSHKPARAKVTEREGGFRGLLQMLESSGTYSISYDTGINRRVMSFPWNWIYEQISEFQAMFSLPSITVYYPDLSNVSTETFKNRFVEVFDDIDARASEVKDGLLSTGDELTSAVSDFSSGAATLPTDVQQIFVSEGEASGEERDWYGEARQAAHEVQDFKQSIESNIDSFDDLYNSITNLPLVEIVPTVVHIKVPYLSRAQILAIIADLQEWKEDAQIELDRVREDWTSCPAGTPLADCSARRAILSHVTTNVDTLIATINGNINVLKDYLDLPELIGSIDMAVAQWLSQIICFLDTTVFSLVHWYMLNKRRLELWIELYFFMQEIINMWAVIKDFFIDYENFCHDCRVDRGGLVLSAFNIFMGLIPTPPIIRFPRLPNITIDLTKIKGGITIPLPRPDIRFVPMIFPKIPRLSLPNSPTFSIELPGIPKIPNISIVPPVPPFPPIPVIELPDLPPPPRIPDIPDFIGDFLSLAQPFLYIYCLFKNGIFPHPEASLKSVIEDLTMRPVTSMFNFDFAGALFEDFEIPSVSAINVEMSLNLDFYAGDFLADAMYAAFAPWNNATTDLRLQAEILKREMYGNLQILENNAEGGNMHLDLSQADNPFSEYFTHLAAAFGDDASYHQAADLRRKYGSRSVRLPDQFPAVAELKDLRRNVALLQEQLLEEHKVLLATRDVTRLKGEFVADSALASAVYETSVSGGLPELEKFSSPEAEAPSNQIESFLDTLQNKADRLLPNDVDVVPNLIEQINEPNQVSEYQLLANDDVVQQEGYFGQCSINGEDLAGRLIYNQELARSIKQTLVSDLDGDGDEEMLLITRSSIYMKENHTEQNQTRYFASAPEIGSFENEIPTHEAVKNIRAISRSDEVTVRFSPKYDGALLGIEITAREFQNGFYGEEDASVENGAVLTALLVPTRFMPQAQTYTNYRPNNTFQIGPWEYSGTLYVEEFIRESVDLPLPRDRFWHIRVREIRDDGFSTASEIVFAAPEQNIDRQAPIILGTQRSKAVLYEDVDLTVPIFDESNAYVHEYSADELRPDEQNIASVMPIDLFETAPQADNQMQSVSDSLNYPDDLSAADFGFVPEPNMTIEWDLNNDGIMDTTGEAITFRPNRPGEYTMTIRATDAAGNSSETEVVVEVTIPEISLEADALQDATVAGKIEPGYAGMPITIIRERDGRTKNLRTESAAEDGQYRTERFGRFFVDDFYLASGAALVNESGDALATIDEQTGRVLFRDKSLSLAATNVGEIRVIEDDSGRVLFSMQHVTDGNADVRVLAQPLSADQIQNFPEGVYLADVNSTDDIHAGSLPGNAPSFPGGAVVYSGNTIIAVVSVLGEVFLADARYAIRVKASESQNEPVILQVTDVDGTARFELLIRSSGDRLYLTKASNTNDILMRNPRSEITLPNTSVTPDKPFSDVPSSHPAFAAIEQLRNKKIVQGYPDGTYHPDEPLTRAEFVKLVLAAADCRDCTLAEPAESTETIVGSFLDILPTAWYRFCVELAHDLELITGYADDTFRPEATISRAEATAILLRAAEIPLRAGTLQQILDLPADAWYLAEMITAVDIGLVPVHFGRVYPEEALTRGEFAQMAVKIFSTNACSAPGPADEGVLIDLCPQVPEDLDGIDDNDGCPEFRYSSVFDDLPYGTYVKSFVGTDEYPYLDFIADIMPGDQISVAITSEDGSEIYSQSPIHTVPFDFSPAR